MKRRGLLALAAAACLVASGAEAKSIVERLLAELRTGGFTQIDVSQTLLGRTRITAERTDVHREIVIDPRTGEILRDYWAYLDGQTGTDLDDDDDDEDDDNSGSGSGSSGSGSGGSGSGGNSGSGSGSSGSGSGGSGSGGGG